MAVQPQSCFGVGSLGRFTGLDQVGEGTYGYVYKARDQSTGETVALKRSAFVRLNQIMATYYHFPFYFIRLIFHKEITGFPLNAVRELKFLKCLQHKNIVQLKDVVSSKGYEQIEKDIKTDTNRGEEKRSDQEKGSNGNNKTVLSLCGNLYLVFEFVEHDLGGLLDSKYKFNIREVKCIAKQLFEVLEFLSERKVLHRDIKSSNILITNRHQIKLADFGLARSIQSADGRELRVDLTNNVVTMWYKPPELILGAVRYAHSVDVWSVGCVLAELELGRPLFPGRTDAEQIDLICRTLGTPSDEIWSGLSKMPNYDSLLQHAPTYNSNLRSSVSGKLSDSITDLLERILVYDPVRRPSAKILLTNKYFNTQPLAPLDPADLEPLHIAPGVSYHEYRTKQQKRQRGADSKEDEVLPAFSPAKSSSSAAPSVTVQSTTSSSMGFASGHPHMNMNQMNMHKPAPPLPSGAPPSYIPGGMAAGVAGAPNGPGPSFPKPPPPSEPKRPRFGAPDESKVPPFAQAFAAAASSMNLSVGLGLGLGSAGGMESYGAPILPAPLPAPAPGMRGGVAPPPTAAAPPIPKPPLPSRSASSNAASASGVPSVPSSGPKVGYGAYGAYAQATQHQQQQQQHATAAGYGASILPKAPQPISMSAAAVPHGVAPSGPHGAQQNAYSSSNKQYGGSGAYGGNVGGGNAAAYRDSTYRDTPYNMPQSSNMQSSNMQSSYGGNMRVDGAGYNPSGMYGSYYDSAGGVRGATVAAATPPMYGASIAHMQQQQQPYQNMPMQGGMQGGAVQGGGTGMYGRPNPDAGIHRYGPAGNGSAYPHQDQQQQHQQRGAYNNMNPYGGRPYRK